jgi:Secretion system C-terminal sorting domain/Pregnancy-associated plasma protein-A
MRIIKPLMYVLIAYLALSTNIFAQSEKCATMQVYEKRIQSDPGTLSRMQQNEIETQTWISENKNLLKHKNQAKSGALVTIPVVVHVLYNNSTENISNEQVQSQIDALNEDFRLLNSDSLDDTHPFWFYTADTQIEFCLASIDPSGNATSGITRTFTNITGFTGDGSEKFTSLGGKDNWDPTKYLNLWVCDLSGAGGLLGYAAFPSDLTAYPDEDGVVIHYQAFGYIGTAGTGGFSGNDLGRTGTHEVGHWLNLRHIWGDDYCGDDFVPDTQIAYDSNYGCPSFPHNPWSTCGSDGDGEMYMNYMDYVDDYCMVMFTYDQGTRMLSTLFGARDGLLTSPGCGTISVNEYLPENSFNLYPNPSNGNVVINSQINGIKNVTISLFDLLGNEIQVFENNSFPFEMNLSDLPNGIYLIKFQSGNQSVTKKLFLSK